MEPQQAICCAFLVFTFKKQDKLALKSLCSWALEDPISLQLLFNALAFLYSTFDFRDGSLEMEDCSNDNHDVFVWTLAECCSQVLSNDICEGLDDVMTCLFEHAERFVVDPKLLEHPIFLNGNVHMLASMCGKAIDTVALGLEKVEAFKEIWKLNMLCGSEKGFERMCTICSLLVESGMDKYLANHTASSTQLRAVRQCAKAVKLVLVPEAGVKFQQTTKDSILKLCITNMENLKTKVSNLTAKALVVPNLMLSRRRFGKVISELIKKDWNSSLRQILDNMKLMPGIMSDNPLLEQFLEKGSYLIKASNSSRSRSFSSSKILLYPKSAPKAGHLNEIALIHRKSMEALIIIHSILWNHQLSLTARLARKSDTGNKEQFVELCTCIKRLCELFSSFSEDFDAGRVLSESSAVSSFSVLLLEYAKSYASLIDRWLSQIFSSNFDSELVRCVSQATHTTLLSGFSFGEIMVHPLLVVLPTSVSILTRIGAPPEVIRSLENVVTKKAATRLHLFNFDKCFTNPPAVVTCRTKVVLKDETVLLVVLSEDVMRYVPAVIWILKEAEKRTIVFGVRDEKQSRKNGTTFSVSFTSSKVLVEDVVDNIALSNALVILLPNQTRHVVKSAQKTILMAKILKHLSGK